MRTAAVRERSEEAEQLKDDQRQVKARRIEEACTASSSTTARPGCTNHVADTHTCTAGQAGYCDGTDASTGIHQLPRLPSSNATDAEEDQQNLQVHEFLGNQAATAVGQGGGMETQARLPAKPADLVRDTKSTRDLDDSQAQHAKKGEDPGQHCVQ